MKNLNQPSTTSTTGQGYYAPPTPPAKPTGAYLPTEQLVKQLKRKKLLSPIAPHHQPVDADTFHGSASEAKKPKAPASQEKKKEHSSAWGWALLIGGGALVALIATLTFNKEAREKVAEVVPFLKTKTEELSKEPPKIDPQQPHIDPNIDQPPNNPQHLNVAPEPVLTDPPQDNTGGNVTGNAKGIGEGSNNNDSNGNLSGTGDSLSEPLNPTNAQGTIPSNSSSEILSEDSLSELVGARREEGEIIRPIRQEIIATDARGELLAPDVLPIQLTTLSSPKLIMPAQEIRHSIDREAGDDAWRFLRGDLDTDVARTDQAGFILPESTDYMYDFKGDAKKLWSTEELFRFQAKLLNAVNNPDRLRPGLKEELMNNQNRQAHFNWQIQHMSKMIIERLERDQYRDQGTARGLNSEENHLALFYAYYNHFHLLAAMKTYKPPSMIRRRIEEASRPDRTQSFMRDTLTEAKKQLHKLEKTPYAFNDVDSEFFSNFLTGYLYPADADSAAKWGAELPSSSGIDFLLQPPHFPSEQAYLSLEKARDSIRVFKELGFEAKQDFYNYLEHAETYYGKQIKDDVHQHRYYGYAGLAETYALRAQVFKLENRDQTTINSMIEEAKQMLKMAEDKSSDARNSSAKKKFDFGYVMDVFEANRIRTLIHEAEP